MPSTSYWKRFVLGESRIQFSSSIATMAASSDVYAVVDKSKKKNKPSTEERNETAPKGDETISGYSMLTFDDKVKGEKKSSTELLSDNVAKTETAGSSNTSNWCASTATFKMKFVMVIFAFSMGVLLFTCFTISVLAVAEIASLKLKVVSLQEASKSHNATVDLNISTLKDQLLEFLQENVSCEFFTASISSCADLPPSSPSGYYWVRASNGSAVRVYCDMTRSCGNITGGWVRVAELDLTNSSHQCPSGLTLHTESDSNIRACVTASTADCVSIPIDIPYSYSRVCGRVIAYQVGATNAFHHLESASDTINDIYVDGVSLTHGNPRQHIWTFAAGLRESMAMNAESTCPCTGNTGATPPPRFVGSDYFCEAALQDHTPTSSTLYYDDPLWDGDGCTDTNPCCSFNNPPWFYKQLPQPTTDNIEMRVCKDEDPSNEDVAIEIVEIYIH